MMGHPWFLLGLALLFVHELDALRSAGADAVKVFNCTGWENLADPLYGNELADMFMAGASQEAKARVRDLVKAVGFADAIDMGGDDKVHILEAFALVWIDLAIIEDGKGDRIPVDEEVRGPRAMPSIFVTRRG